MHARQSVLLFAILAVLAQPAEAARLSLNMSSSVDSDGERQFRQTISAGSLVDTNGTKDCDLSKFGNRFTEIQFAGKGGFGCVSLAKDTKNGDRFVAIKISYKGRGGSNYWKTECEKSQSIHKKACSKGPEVLKLVEAYLPACFEVGDTEGMPYMVMHAAGGVGMGKRRLKIDKQVKQLSMAERVSLFAQGIGALSAMHSVGFAHNDLHFQNIQILDGIHQNNNHLALIDFGSSWKWPGITNTKKQGGYRADSTFPARLAAQLALCPESRGDPLLECLKQRWHTNDEFLGVMDRVMEEERAQKPATLLSALYNTAFVQQHQPKLESRFSTGKCK